MARCTRPCHLSRWQRRIDVISSVPSFYSSEAEGASSLPLLPQIQQIIAAVQGYLHPPPGARSMHQVISVEKLPWHTSAELTRKRFQHQDEEQGARNRALMHTWCTDVLPRQTPRCTVHWPAHDSGHWSRFHYSSTVAIYTNDYVFISMNCIKKETKHITYCIEGADTKK